MLARSRSLKFAADSPANFADLSLVGLTLGRSMRGSLRVLRRSNIGSHTRKKIPDYRHLTLLIGLTIATRLNIVKFHYRILGTIKIIKIVSRHRQHSGVSRPRMALEGTLAGTQILVGQGTERHLAVFTVVVTTLACEVGSHKIIVLDLMSGLRHD